MAKGSAFTHVPLKQCPDCSDTHEPELENCQCGYDFVNNPVPTKMVLEIDMRKVTRLAKEEEKRRKKLRNILTLAMTAIILVGLFSGSFGLSVVGWIWLVGMGIWLLKKVVNPFK